MRITIQKNIDNSTTKTKTYDVFFRNDLAEPVLVHF